MKLLSLFLTINPVLLTLATSSYMTVKAVSGLSITTIGHMLLCTTFFSSYIKPMDECMAYYYNKTWMLILQMIILLTMIKAFLKMKRTSLKFNSILTACIPNKGFNQPKPF
jgi:hypothetical protein